MIKKLAPIVTIVVALCILIYGILAVNEDKKYAVNGHDTTVSTPIEISVGFTKGDILLIRNNLVYTLYLPAYADLKHIVYKDDKPLYINERLIVNGDLLPNLTLDHEISITLDGVNYSLKVMKSEYLPTVFITTDSQDLNLLHSSRTIEDTGFMTIIKSDSNTIYNNKLTQIKTRGHSTWGMSDKKPYQIKLENSSNLLDMGEDKTWILLSNYADQTLIRNELAQYFGALIGFNHTDKGEQVDLYIDSLYRGTYYLCEKIEIDDARVDIFDLEKATEAVNALPLEEYTRGGAINSFEPGSMKWTNVPIDPENITGGYLLEFENQERYLLSMNGFVTNKGQCITIKEPGYPSENQVRYIQTYVQELEDAIYGDNGYNTLNKHYSDYLDLESFVLRFLAEEYLLNSDAWALSFYWYKDLDDQLMSGPLWDYDLSLSNSKASPVDPTAWWGMTRTFNSGKGDVHWITQLLKEDEFSKYVVETYNHTVSPAIKLLLENYDEFAQNVIPSAKMNFDLWGNDGYNSVTELHLADNHQGQLTYLSQFMFHRSIFFEDTIGMGNIPTLEPYYDIIDFYWYAEAVNYVTDQELMEGYNELVFAPEGNMQVSDFLVTLGRLANIWDLSTDENKPTYEYYKDWALASNIIYEANAGDFNLYRDLSRSDMVGMLYRLNLHMGKDTEVKTQIDLEKFVDGTTIGNYSKPSFLWALDTGIISGNHMNQLRPYATATRKEVAQVVMNYHQLFE